MVNMARRRTPADGGGSGRAGRLDGELLAMPRDGSVRRAAAGSLSAGAAWQSRGRRSSRVIPTVFPQVRGPSRSGAAALLMRWVS